MAGVSKRLRKHNILGLPFMVEAAICVVVAFVIAVVVVGVVAVVVAARVVVEFITLPLLAGAIVEAPACVLLLIIAATVEEAIFILPVVVADPAPDVNTGNEPDDVLDIIA